MAGNKSNNELDGIQGAVPLASELDGIQGATPLGQPIASSASTFNAGAINSQPNEMNFQPTVVGGSNNVASQTGGLFSGFSKPNPEGSLASSFVKGITGPFETTAQLGNAAIKKLEANGLPVPASAKGFFGLTQKVADVVPKPAAPPSDTFMGAVAENLPGIIVGEGAVKILGGESLQAISQARKIALPSDITNAGQIASGPAARAVGENLDVALSKEAALRAQAASQYEGFQNSTSKVVDDAAQRAATHEATAAAGHQALDAGIADTNNQLINLRQQRQLHQEFSDQQLSLLDPADKKAVGQLKSSTNATQDVFNNREQDLQLKLQNQVDQRQEINDSLTTRLSNESDKLESRLETLKDKYNMNASRLESSDPNVRQTVSEQLHDNLVQQYQLKNMADTLKIKAPNPELLGQFPGSSKEMAMEAASEQTAKINKLLADGKLTEAQAVKLRAAETDNTLRLYGVDPGTIDKSPSSLGWLTDWTTRLNFMQRRTGVATGRTALELSSASNQIAQNMTQDLAGIAPIVEDLQKMGYSRSEIFRKLQYVDDVGYDPSPLKLVRMQDGSLANWSPELSHLRTPVNIPRDITPPPTAEAMEKFKQLRQFWNTAGDTFEVGEKLPRYVPQMRARNAATLTDEAGTTSSAIQTAGFQHMRENGELLAGTHDMDVMSVAKRYLYQGYRQQLMGPVVEDAIQQFNLLRQVGAAKDASNFKNYLVEALGLKDENGLAALMTDHSLAKTPEVNKLLSMVPDPESFWKELYSTARKVFYQNTVGLSSKVFVAHAFQPEAFAVARLGTSVEQARLVMVSPTANAGRIRSLAEQVVQASSRPELVKNLQEPEQYAFNKFLNWVNKPSEKIQELGLGNLAGYNRKLVATAGIVKWEAAAAKGTTQELLSQLTTGERSLVMRAYQNGGDEAAKKAYALVQTNSANGIFGLANKPEALQKGLASTVEFTQFPRTVLSNYVDAIGEGQYGRVAKMIASQMGIAVALKTLFGKAYADKNPAQEVGTLATRMTPVPMASGPISELVTKGPQKAAKRIASEMFAPYSIYNKIEKESK